MSYSEWDAAMEGAMMAAGHDITPPLTESDFGHLAHLMGPSQSIRA